VLGALEEVLGRALFKDLALVHEQDAVRHLAREPHLVRDHDHGHAVAGQPFHDVENLADHLGIEGRGGLVEEHDLGVHGQGAGDGHALLLSAREIVGVGGGLVGQPHAGEKSHGLLLGGPSSPAAHHGLADGHVL